MKDKKTEMEEILWQVTDEVRNSRLQRFVVPMEDQSEFESARLWNKVSEAIANDDQNAATEEKSFLEEEQRAAARERKATCTEHVPKYFELDTNCNATGQYLYKHADARPWDPLNDLIQYEKNYIIGTKTKHKTPMIRTQSIVSVSKEARKAAHNAMEKSRKRSAKASVVGNAGDELDQGGEKIEVQKVVVQEEGVNVEAALQPLRDQQRQMTERLAKLQHTLDVMSYQQKERDSNSNINRDMVLLVVLVVMIQVNIMNFYVKMGQIWIRIRESYLTFKHFGKSQGA